MKESKDRKDKKIEELEKKIEDVEDSWKRALADYTNLQRRIEEERKEIGMFANEVLILKLLPVLDSFEKLEEHSKDQGLKLSIKEFRQSLKDIGLEEIDAEGKFNPDEMEAIDIVSGEKDKVISIEQKGYKLNNKLIRPARVTVGQETKEK